MVPDGKGHNLVFNSILTAIVTRDEKSLLKALFGQFPFSPATKEAHWGVISLQSELAKPGSAVSIN